MKLSLAVAVLLVSCGADQEVELPQAPSVVSTSPSTFEALPPGWYLHLYPGICVVLVRDADGVVRRCIESFPATCVAPAAHACLSFPIGSVSR